MAFTEFYCNASTGSNLNAGSSEGSPLVTATGGNWTNATDIYTTIPAQNLVTAGVTVGMFASIFVDGSSGPAVFIGRIATIITVNSTNDSVTIDTGVRIGTIANGSGNRSMIIGGVWLGPNAASSFPFEFITLALVNTTGDKPRVNFKNNALYAITAAMTRNIDGPVVFQGYTSTVGDLGKAIVDGGTVGGSYVLLTISTAGIEQNIFRDLVFQNNGATGSANGVTVSTTSSRTLFERLRFKNVRRAGLAGLSQCSVIDCEATGCNQSNTVGVGGFNTGSASTFVRCLSHDNVGSNSCGFVDTGSNNTFIDCIAETNGADGFQLTINGRYLLRNCTAYNNTRDGIRIMATLTTSVIYIENSLLISNGAFGINNLGGNDNLVLVNYCGFFGNTSGQTSGLTIGGVLENNLTLSAQPMTDPGNGDFSPQLNTIKSTGRGTFTQDTASYTKFITSYLDIGAVQDYGVNSDSFIMSDPRIADRVRETSTTTGTGDITLIGAVGGYRSFSSGIGIGFTCLYCIANRSVTEFEVGVGTVISSTILRRDRVLSNSSGTDSLITFSAGTKDVFVDAPSSYICLAFQAARRSWMRI